MTTILRCPFCGGEAARIPDDIEKEIAICLGCMAFEAFDVWQRRVAPRLSFICANCGSPQEAEGNSIDNGTDLQCQECEGHSVVNLFRADEYPMICEAIQKLRNK